MPIDHNHPLLQGGTVGLMSGEMPKFDKQVEAPEGVGEHEHLLQILRQMGLRYEATHGRYDSPERSVVIHKPTEEQMRTLGRLFGQESVVFSQGGRHKLIYTNGDNKDAYRTTVDGQHPYQLFGDPPDNNYTYLPGKGYVSINFDFGPGSLKNLSDDQPRPEAPAKDAPAVKSERSPIVKYNLHKALPRNERENNTNAAAHAVLEDYMEDKGAVRTEHGPDNQAAELEWGGDLPIPNRPSAIGRVEGLGPILQITPRNAKRTMNGSKEFPSADRPAEKAFWAPVKNSLAKIRLGALARKMLPLKGKPK